LAFLKVRVYAINSEKKIQASPLKISLALKIHGTKKPEENLPVFFCACASFGLTLIYLTETS
jgi:hypothetical protein